MNIIKINPKYENLVPKLSIQDYNKLKQSIKENGLLVSLIVNKNGILIDGHHRYKACQELGIKPRLMQRKFQDELEKKEIVIEINAKRRHLNDFQTSGHNKK